MNKQMPEACEAVMGTGTGTEAREEDDEYDEAIRRRRRQQVRGQDLDTHNVQCMMLIGFRNYKKLPTIQSNPQRTFKVVWLLLLFLMLNP